MRVYQLAREFSPYANAGGLKEVVTGIAKSLSDSGHDSSVFIPCYGFINKNKLLKKDSFQLLVKGENIIVNIYFTFSEGIKLYLIDFPAISDKKSVYTYTVEDEIKNYKHKRGEGFYDNGEINIILQMSFLQYVTDFLEMPDVINLHDGHTGLVPAMIKSNENYRDNFKKCKIFFTIHNAGIIYHQRVPCKTVEEYNIIKDEFLNRGCFHSELDPLCLAVLYSKALTVSPFYAQEILSLAHEDSTSGFGTFCNENKIEIIGITNGINLNHYSKLLLNGYPTINNKQKAKQEIHELLKDNNFFNVWGSSSFSAENPLYLFQNRITEQKGIDNYILSIKSVINLGTKSKFIIMGQGEAKYEDRLISLAKEHSEEICYIQGYDEFVALNIFLSSDFFISTSLWEPCGLTDLESQLVGSIPIVHNVGGLKKVLNGKTGFVYDDFSELEQIVIKCEKLYFNDSEQLDIMKKQAYENICENYTWDMVLKKRYIPLFETNNDI